jgi:hypothetical protein
LRNTSSGGVEPGKRVRERELQALVHPDRPVEDNPLVAVFHGLLKRYAADAERLGGDEHTFGVEPVEDVLETLALFADTVSDRHHEVVDEHLVGAHGVAAHLVDRPDVDVVTVEISEEQRHAVGLLRDLVIGRGAVSSRIFSDSSALEIQTFLPLTR